MQNSNIHSLERISQSTIQSGNISLLETPEARINTMLNDYSFRISSLESKVETIENDVGIIKSNYLTKSDFYKTGAVALFTLIVAALGSGWLAFENLDRKIASASDKSDRKFELVDQRFQKVEEKISSMDVQLAKVESRLDNVEYRLNNMESRLSNVEKKLDSIDDKLDLLIQQKQTSR